MIMPVADVADWIGAAVRSVLSQTMDDLELIIAVDRSTDGTLELAQDFASQDSRIKLIEVPGYGGGRARNAAIDVAEGTYLAFADGDDLVPSTAYEAMLDSLDRTGSEMVVGDYVSFSTTAVWRRSMNLPTYRARQGITLPEVPLLSLDRVVWNRMVSRDAWNGIGARFSSAIRSNDISAATWTSCSLRFDVIDTPVYAYRRRVGMGSMTQRRSEPASLEAYVEEEARCLQMIKSLRNRKLERVYAKGLLHNDVPSHVAPAYAANGAAGLPSRFTPLVDDLLSIANRQADEPSAVLSIMIASGLTRGSQLLAHALTSTADSDSEGPYEFVRDLRSSELRRRSRARARNKASYITASFLADSIIESRDSAAEEWLAARRRGLRHLVRHALPVEYRTRRLMALVGPKLDTRAAAEIASGLPLESYSLDVRLVRAVIHRLRLLRVRVIRFIHSRSRPA